MRRRLFFSALAVLSALAAPAGAVDLAKFERSIRKEPVYESKDPRYCLTVFGPEAKVLVWLVLDGDVLYVDRNGNGDLTEPGDRIEPRSVLHDSPQRPDMKLICTFICRRLIKDGEAQGEPILSCIPDMTWLCLEHCVPSDERHDALAESFRKRPFRVAIAINNHGEDSSLAFAPRCGDAPILHFDGPRQLALHAYSEPLRRGETSSLAVELRTPGLGASVRTDCPTGVNAVAEIECPPRRVGAAPVRFRLELPGHG